MGHVLWPLYDGKVGLSLLAGPANAGKVALLLERYLARLDDEPVLIVPNASDVDRVERDLLARRGCLFSGEIVTFDRLFESLVRDDPGRRPVATDHQRALIVRRAVGGSSLNGLSASARTSGFADALQQTLGELESGLLDPSDLDGDLPRLYEGYRTALDRLALCDLDPGLRDPSAPAGALAGLYEGYRAELDRLGLWDLALLRRRAAERLQSDLDAWHGEPVFAYGFEDLTSAQWSLLEALAGRAEVHVSLPYEPGRVAFASLRRTVEDLAALADGRTRELGPRSSEYAAPALAHLERTLFERAPAEKPSPAGAVRFLEGAGMRDTLELVAQELLALLREGVRAESIALVVPSAERFRAPLETALNGFGIPYAVEARRRLGSTPVGHALTSLLRFAWADGGRKELFGFLRSPYSGLARSSVDYVEGRLRGRAVESPERVVAETERLREAPLVALRELREAATPLEGVRTLLAAMLRSAYGLEAPPAGETSRLDLRCFGTATTLLDELEE